MLMALLKGKLSSEQQNMEDILTSNVFGTLQYLPPSQALLPFIAKAVDEKGNHPLEDIRKTAAVDYEFWPYLSESGCNPCEPDVLLRITEPQSRGFIVLIEAKYLSGKSSEGDEGERPNDQLAREYDNLRFLADKEKRYPILIYLTAGLQFPKDEIEASKSELYRDRNIAVDFSWLSWRHLIPVIENAEEPMLDHLAQIMTKLNLLFFSGFSPIGKANPISWSFTQDFNWQLIGVPQSTWRFES